MTDESNDLPPTFQVGSPRLDRPRTYVIFGVSRGGTTMVAGVASRLGLDLGSGYGHTFEDPRFNLNELAVRHRSRQEQLDVMRDSIVDRNAAADVWGWKFPNAYRYLADVVSTVREPHLVVVCRDTAAVLGRGRRPDEEVPTALVRTAQMNLKNMRLLKRLGAPGLVVSYERALARPLRFTGELAAFLGLEPPADTSWFDSYISPGYKTLAQAQE